MSRLTVLALALLLALSTLADGTVTAPVSIAPASWKIAQIHEITGSNGDSAGVSIVVHYFDAQSALVLTTSIALTSAEISSYVTMCNSPVAGEAGSAIKRRRQRITKWLVDNAKIVNVTPEP